LTPNSLPFGRTTKDYPSISRSSFILLHQSSFGLQLQLQLHLNIFTVTSLIYLFTYSLITNKKMPKTGIAATIARPNILALQPYRCARDDYSTGILLDANENAIGPTSLPTNSLESKDNHLSLERYPCPYQITLKTAYANYRHESLEAKNVFVGVGSDEAIDLLMRIFCKPGIDEIMITPPTYGMYNVCANVNDVGIVKVPLTEDFDLRIPEVSLISCVVFFVFFGWLCCVVLCCVVLCCVL